MPRHVLDADELAVWLGYSVMVRDCRSYVQALCHRDGWHLLPSGDE
jgi:hypothetical protein